MALNKNSEDRISYTAIGDSYTIGLGVDEDFRWPNVLVDRLRQEGINIDLMANPAVSGYTVKDATKLELPVVEKVKPDFVTVLIGANDSFGQKNAGQFRLELKELLDKLQRILTNPKNIVLITIPDYSKTPAFKAYQTQDALALIEEYNRAIKDEANERGLKVADIFPNGKKQSFRLFLNY